MLPQLLLTVFFFLWPAGEAIWSSLTRQDPFGLGSAFVGLENFSALFADPLSSTPSSAHWCSVLP